MKIIIEPNYEAISARAAADLLAMISKKESPLLCTASGDSPKGIYRHLAQKIKQENIDISKWKFVGLDEWMGMNASVEGSCRFHLDRDLFGPLGVKESSICFFDGKATDPKQEARRTDQFIEAHGGIEVAIVGLGMNGHVGMNEPGTDPDLHSHIAEIDPLTASVGQKYFTQKTTLSHGLTLGIASLLEARQVFLVVSGEKKAAMVRQVIEGPVSPEIPASLLRRHSNFFIYLDQPASGLIQPTDL